MTDEEIEKGLKNPWYDGEYHYVMHCDVLDYINRLKADKQLAKTQLKDLLSALYQRADNKDKSFTIYQNDIVELAEDYGIKEEELK